ncbi:MarR family winged helix-turn-helix transcriptional regulator [Rhodococcus sp. NBC_00297]|uniref:MarR family winged helix-turn-helix transcriptional regulator n=1 Tax=Rhodococcus sp. NBC_00297 TaxID=2976005 RepID=UPI002E2BD949|nr:MarR family winged helix-turn-helix transcriptional regulator [Rhodococcus sp. NBC_00297]
MPESASPFPASFNGGQVSYTIFELARAHRGYASTLLRGLELHPGQELILMHLHHRDGQTQSELVASVGVDHSTMSKALRRMQDTGLIVREPAEHDRRVSVAHLTSKGEAMREPIAAMWRELESVTTRDLTTQQAASLLTAAHTIIDSIRGRTTPDGPDERGTP